MRALQGEAGVETPQALPGLGDSSTLGQLDPDENAHKFLKTRLLRERNRIEHALRAALRVVHRAQTPAL